MKRSVERVDGVKNVLLDLNTGRLTVVFRPGKTARPADLWNAVIAGGFTPSRVETEDEVYEGPKP